MSNNLETRNIVEAPGKEVLDDRVKYRLRRFGRGILKAGATATVLGMALLASYGADRYAESKWDKLKDPVPAGSELAEQLGQDCVKTINNDPEIDFTDLRSIQGGLLIHDDVCQGTPSISALSEVTSDFEGRRANAQVAEGIDNIVFFGSGVAGTMWALTALIYDDYPPYDPPLKK